ncbi:MAG: glycosyltransferase [Planctomycetota bacterium]
MPALRDAGKTSTDDSRPEYSIVIPIFNEEGNIPALNSRLVAVLEQLGKPYEIIYIDDGSRDRSAALLDELAGANPRVRVIHFTRNFGQHPAVYAGFAAVRGAIVVTLDGDLQNPPEEIPKLLARLDNETDVVAGVRMRRHDSILRTLPSRFVNWMVGKLTGVALRDYGCLLRAYRRDVIDKLLLCRERTKYFTALISWLGVRIAEVPVEHAPRGAGTSKYHFLKLVSMNFDLLTGYSIMPIQFISLGGLLFAVIGFVLALFFLVLWLVYGGSQVWWVLLSFSAFFLLFGLQVMALGFIGEYIGRIMIEVKDRPYYLIRSEVNAPKQQAP